jgi:hypothetical protein
VSNYGHLGAALRVDLAEIDATVSNQAVNGSRKLISWRQSKIDQLGFIGRRP